MSVQETQQRSYAEASLVNCFIAISVFFAKRKFEQLAAIRMILSTELTRSYTGRTLSALEAIRQSGSNVLALIATALVISSMIYTVRTRGARALPILSVVMSMLCLVATFITT
jgi:hypothetical protein